MKMRGDMATFKETILLKMDSQPQDMCDAILGQLQVNGAVPITAQQITGMFDTFRAENDKFRTELLSRLETRPQAERGAGPIPSAPNNLPATNTTIELDGHTFSMWTWGSRLHPVPQNWVFPICTTSVLWDLWLDGKRNDGIQPFSFLKNFDLNAINYVRLSKARTVMEHVIAKTEKSIRNIRALSTADRDKLFADTFHELAHRLYPNKPEAYFLDPKFQSLCFLRVYDLIKDADKRDKRERAAAATAAVAEAAAVPE